jgi:bacillithiol biosynthesis cysteine-adding enzyme BshC
LFNQRFSAKSAGQQTSMSTNIPITSLGLIPAITKDYLEQKDVLKPFYKYAPTIDSFGEVIKNNCFSVESRTILVDALLNQYKNGGIDLGENDATYLNTLSIKNTNTFTVTTGHQLALFTGQLYFIYKIATVINLAKQLKDKYLQQNFVPVFWMASEDHDFEEISSIYLFGKEIKWQKDTHSKPVGLIDNTGIEALIEQLIPILGERDKAKKWIKLLQESFLTNNNFSIGTRKLVHELFKNHGLVIIDADNKALKALLKPVMVSDIFKQKSFNAIQNTNKALSENYKLQINGREVNFFYLHPELGRKLIKPAGTHFLLNDTEVVFTKDELQLEIENYPERFSPNVVLRPVYQELILPNLAYIGGPAEVAYWLQLQQVFEAHLVPFPVVMQRNSYLLLGKSIKDKIEKMGLSIGDMFLNDYDLTDKYLQKHSASNFLENANQVDVLLQQMFDEVKNIDPISGKEILQFKLESKKVLMANFKTYKKAREQKQEDNIVKMLKLKERIFPNGTFQERLENVMMHDINLFDDLIEKVLQNADAFSNDLIVLEV